MSMYSIDTWGKTGILQRLGEKQAEAVHARKMEVQEFNSCTGI